MGQIVYVTGAPATGKSTLCTALSKLESRVELFCYSQRLRDHINTKRGAALDETAIRRESAGVVTSQDVNELDDLLHDTVTTVRASPSHLIIDSHPVTKETYGFRVTPFSADRLRALEIDTLICLYADPHQLAERIRLDPQGRPLPSDFELSVHVQLQASIVAQYSVLAGRPCYLVAARSKLTRKWRICALKIDQGVQPNLPGN